jgi:hypothetical protein
VKLREIVFAGDFLRPVQDEFRPSQTENVQWFYRLFRRRLQQAANLPISCITWGEGIDTPLLFDLFGATPDVEGWAAFFSADAVPQAVLDVYEKTFRGSLVVSFELAESSKRVLTHLGIPYIDMGIHPIRFLPDVFFALQTNDPEIFAAILPRHVEPLTFYDHADLVSATAVKFFPKWAPESSLLLIGQTGVDRSLVCDEKLIDLAHFGPRVRRAVARHGDVMFKPHPYNPTDFGLFDTGVPFRRIHRTTTNVYAALAHDDLREVMGVSSSVMMEAPFFGKRAEFLYRSPFDLAGRRDEAQPHQHLNIIEACFETDFWRDALAPVVPVTAHDGHRPVMPPNSLRTSLRNFWGFNELTTDFWTQLFHERR